MSKYFDAFLHVTEWGTRILMFRLPASALPTEMVGPYCRGKIEYASPLQVTVADGNAVLRFCSHEDERWGHSFQADRLLPALSPLRMDLARGDHRALYLAWLRGLRRCALPHEEEPPLPPGLKSLSPALAALVEFLEIDPDLVTAACEASQKAAVNEPSRSDWRVWLETLSTAEKDDWLLNTMQGRGPQVGLELERRFMADRMPGAGRKERPRKRTVGELLALASEKRGEREREAGRREAEEKARLELEAASRRERHLAALEPRAEEAWARVDELVTLRNAKAYAEATQLLADLREIALRRGRASAFDRLLSQPRTLHERKRGFIEQLRARGL